MTNLGAPPPENQFFAEFPRSTYSEVLEITLAASLEERPTEKSLLNTALEHLVSLAATSSYSPKLESIKYLSCYESPNWGASLHYLKYYVLAIVEDDEITKPINTEWRSPSEVLTDYAQFRLRLSPPTLGLLRGLQSDLEEGTKSVAIGSGSHTYRFWHALAQETAQEKFGVLTHLEYAPGIECIPVASNTLTPFHATNLITVLSGDVLLIVDPGANDVGKAHLFDILARFGASTLLIFLTHHHHDHVHSLNAVAEAFPNATLIGHPYTLKKINTPHIARRLVCAEDQDEILNLSEFSTSETSSSAPSRTLTVISVPGHTRGHLALWDPVAKILVSGDHTVGYGSSVLDPNGGGNMASYLASTQRLLDLDIQAILPCHGSPTLQNPKKLLRTYISHRISREKEIANLWQKGNQDADAIVKIIYVDTPEKMHPVAKRNVLLHLEKLGEEGIIKLTNEVSLQIQEYHRKRDEFVYI
jgi:glyoxylase-like metal-dependent hydrolase (beta-lactamase superfamily II)